MTAGSVLLYTGSVIHGGGANRTDADRIGVLLHYTLDWLRQEENLYISCPPHVAKDLSPELRALPISRVILDRLLNKLLTDHSIMLSFSPWHGPESLSWNKSPKGC